MADCALKSNGSKASARIEESCDSQHRIQFKQIQGDRWVIQVDLSDFQCANDRLRKSVNIDLESHSSGGGRAYSRADASKFRSFDRLVKF